MWRLNFLTIWMMNLGLAVYLLLSLNQLESQISLQWESNCTDNKDVYYLTTITSAYFKRISIACRQGRFRCLCLQVSDWILVAQCDLLLRITFFLGCQTSMLFRERTKGKLKIP
jgi:hypothetical protein